MLALSNAKLSQVSIGTNVLSHVSDVDRDRTAPRSILSIVLKVNNSRHYELGTKEGRLERLYAKNEFCLTV